MGIPLGDGGEKKFNWASELSTDRGPLGCQGVPRICFLCNELHMCICQGVSFGGNRTLIELFLERLAERSTALRRLLYPPIQHD